MSAMDIVNHTLEVVDLFPQSGDDEALTGAGVDVRGHRFAVSKIHLGTMSGTNTASAVVQMRTAVSTWVPITGAASGALDDAFEESVQRGLIDLTKLSGFYAAAPELRHVITIAGTGAVLLSAAFELAGHCDKSLTYGSTNAPRLWEVIADGN